MNIKSFVFLDLETTGLPHQQNNQTKITELCFLSVQTDHILLGAVPRVQNKLNLCFNPWKVIEPTVESITGLSNDLLEYQSSFDETTLSILTNFLERLPKPICFVAHNGHRFDYPILKYHIEKIKKDFIDHIFCIDSFEAFKSILTENKTYVKQNSSNLELDISDDWDSTLVEEVILIENNVKTNECITRRQQLNETTPNKMKMTSIIPIKNFKQKAQLRSTLITDFTPYSRKIPVAKKRLDFDNNSLTNFKLSNVYELLLKRPPENAHHAEVDVKMMLDCAVHLGDKFVDWANSNAKLFVQISRMQPKVIKS